MLKIIISPAKKMVENSDVFETTTPIFLSESEKIKSQLQSLDFDALQQIWKCGMPIARLNFQRLEEMSLTQNQTPAIISYEGLQYKHMGASVLSNSQIEYLSQHLRILSGFYGILKPLDGVVPYRLEMQAKVNLCGCKDVYSFWGDKLAKSLMCEDDGDKLEILNLASKEYSKAVLPHIPKKVAITTVTFCENAGGKLVEKGTMCKMARGEMVGFMAENNIQTAEEIKSFNRMGYVFSKENSTRENIVFIRR